MRNNGDEIPIQKVCQPLDPVFGISVRAVIDVQDREDPLVKDMDRVAVRIADQHGSELQRPTAPCRTGRVLRVLRKLGDVFRQKLEERI